MNQKTHTAGLFRVTRGDYRAARVLLIAGLVAWIAGTLLPQILGWFGADPLIWRMAAVEQGPATGEVLVQPGSVHWDERVIYELTEPGAAQRFGALLPALVTTSVLVAAVLILWRLLSLVSAGEPFARPAARWVRILGVLGLFWAIVGPPVQMIATMLVLGPAQREPGLLFSATTSQIGIAILALAGGLLLILLAEVFTAGEVLRDDVEGLV